MAKVSNMIVSKFLRKEDIDDDVLVTIKGCSLEDMPGDTREQRWTLTFRELPKALVLNTTGIRVLEKSYGGDSDEWIGKKVTLYVDPNVSFKGQVVGGLRLRPQKGKPPSSAPPASETPFDDAIP